MKKTIKYLLVYVGFGLLCLNMGHNNSYSQNNLAKNKTSRKIESAKVFQLNPKKQKSKFLKEDYSYDKKGNLNVSNEYTDDGRLRRKYVSVFDSLGKVVEEYSYHWDELYSKEFYKYDSLGNIILKNTYYTEGYETCCFTKNKVDGNVVESLDSNSDGSLGYKWVNTYNLKGNILETLAYSPIGWITGQDIYKYDENDNLIEHCIYCLDERPVWKIMAKFDNHGVVVEQSYYNKMDELTSFKTYTYEFDIFGNWIKQTVFSDKILEYTLIREIKYY